jgi:hypothetical protein
LRKTPARNWHCPPIGFKEEECAIVGAALIWKLQCKNEVRNDAKFYATTGIHFPSKQLMIVKKPEFIFR